MNATLSKLWWLWIPATLLPAQIVIECILSNEQKRALLQEGGIHENFQAFIMTCAFLLALPLLKSAKGKWLKLWYLAAAFGTLFVAGEELSWGQWLLQWATPEGWSAINDQNETNLHNTSDWLDQKPFILLSIGVLVGGIIIPIMQNFWPEKLTNRFAPIYGDYRLLPTALVALTIKLIDTYNDATHTIFFWRISEVLELYVYYFVFLYLMLMKKKAAS